MGNVKQTKVRNKDYDERTSEIGRAYNAQLKELSKNYTWDNYQLYQMIDKLNPYYEPKEKTLIRKWLWQGRKWYGLREDWTLLNGCVYRCIEAQGCEHENYLDFVKWIKVFKEIYPHYNGK
jgi:hypothetical protein